jgi:hypothetical protein
MTSWADEDDLRRTFAHARDGNSGGSSGVAALVVLERGRDCWTWRVVRCPFCGRRHTHGGGPFGDDPRRYLGHRTSHCGAARGRDYALVEAPMG